MSMLGPWDEEVLTPDAIEPVTGYRAFVAEWLPDRAHQVKLGHNDYQNVGFNVTMHTEPAGPRLGSLIFDDGWLPGDELKAYCGIRPFTHDPEVAPDGSCTCGLYAAGTMAGLHDWSVFMWHEGYVEEHAHHHGITTWKTVVVAEVAGWGRVIQHERGWRSQYMSVKSWLVPFNGEAGLRLQGLLLSMTPWCDIVRFPDGDEHRDISHHMAVPPAELLLPRDRQRLLDEMWANHMRARQANPNHGKLFTLQRREV